MSVAVLASEAGALASPDGSRVLKGRRPMCADVGVSIRTFSELEARGVIVPLERGRGGRGSVYDAVETLKRVLQHVRQEHPAGGERAARERRDLATAALAEQLHRRRAGETIDVADVRHVFSNVVIATRAKLLRLPVAVAEECAREANPAKVQALLDRAVRDALTELSRGGDLIDTTPPPAASTSRRKRR